MLVVKNHGPLVLQTNFWELPTAVAGEFLVTPNAGAFRVLLPVQWEDFIDDMRTARGCAVSRGPWPGRGLPDAFEVLFDDGTADPFAMHGEPRTFLTAPRDEDAGTEWVLSVWTRPRRGRPHKALERPCRYRRSPRLPDLRPWEAR